MNQPTTIDEGLARLEAVLAAIGLKIALGLQTPYRCDLSLLAC
jgi:hypothetical protein